ncbi:glutamate ABC transporter substrate-binding protein [Dactylosporangium sp. CA-233914]|uniref:glutamate ABC transporter substrate-binding protein n=1 Tax=Dactylosporangium sp. CA-233914 TaxID=3239934 RepID=UPI003D923443
MGDTPSSHDNGPVAEVTFEAGTTMDRLHRAGKIRIGTKFDQPGFGLAGPDGKPTGFDVEIGKIVAAELGIPAAGIEWVESTPKVREEYLGTGKVDIVVATYTITAERLERVDFAGPYYVAGQQITTRTSGNSVTGPKTFRLGTKKVCSSTGSTPAKNITTYLKDPAAQLVLFDVYTKCADALRAGQVDAVTTDNVILTGFVAQHPEDFKLVGARFTTEPYGIGLRKGDHRFRAFVNDVLETIAKDGRYAKAWTGTAGRYDPAMPEAPAVSRY